MKFWILLIAGAVGPYLFASTLPSPVVFALLPPLALAACFTRSRRIWVAPLSFLLVTVALNGRLEDRLPPEAHGGIQEISGRVASLPERNEDTLRFVFEPDSDAEALPKRIRVSWYRNRYDPDDKLPPVRAGEHWRLRLDLRMPRGRVNFHGMDAERWYFADGIGARSLVRDGPNILLAAPGAFDLQHLRETVLEQMEARAGEAPAFRVLAALAVADRRGLMRTDRLLLSATGTGHLLAISGLHIGLAAALGFWLGRLGSLCTPYAIRLRAGLWLPWLTSWLAALAYAALSGFGVSTQRALIMLSVATVAVLARRHVHPFQAWLVAMALVLFADPFAPLRAGFWFSFTAVAVLLALFVPRHGQMGALRRILLAQAGISLVMAPLTMYWFQQASVPGFLANLVAIPVVSMLVVPLILLALPLLWLTVPLAPWLLSAAGYVMQGLIGFLEFVAQLQPASLAATRTPGLVATLLAMLGGVILTLPRGVKWRYTGLLLIVPLLLPPRPQPGPGETQVDLLDVGQGLAVLVTGEGMQVLYDTGPGNGLPGEERWDLVDGTIAPMINATGHQPDLVVASHADLDHSGGLQRLLDVYPGSRFTGSFPEPVAGVAPCIAPRDWRAGQYSLSILHPSAGLPYLGNASSCTLSIRGHGMSILLGGDINTAVEQRLAVEGLGPHDLLVAPHHGSSTSSSQVLLDATQPALALVSAGADNRFGLPHRDVLIRLERAGIPVVNTARCGGLRINAGAGGLYNIESARTERRAIWRYPAHGSCPR